MKVDYSKTFTKTVEKLSVDKRNAVSKVITQVKKAAALSDIRNCKKLSGYKNVYRIRIGDYRAIFLFIVVDEIIYFQYFLHRGEAYNKEYLKNLKIIE
jgi:Plasmid stabilisation system protein.